MAVCEWDQGSQVPFGFFTSWRDPLEVLLLGDGSFDPGVASVVRCSEAVLVSLNTGLVRQAWNCAAVTREVSTRLARAAPYTKGSHD
jgi:hypothetical protein